MSVATDVRIATVQLAPKFGSVKSNRERTVERVRSNQDADLVILPELITTGYVFESTEEVILMAEPQGGPTGQAWADVAAETETWIVGGFAEVSNQSVYNSAMIVSPDGIEGVYRKVHLWNKEKRWFDAGSELPVFHAPFGRFGVQICNDLWFAEQTIAQACDDIDLVAVPTNWVPESPGEDRPGGWTMGVHQAIAHANANQVFIACADRSGTERNVTFEGQSVIVDPYGSSIAGPAPVNGEHVVATDCDLTIARNKALTANDDALGDRRPDVYGLNQSSSDDE